MGDIGSQDEQTPAVKAIEVIIDPSHPEAGKGGVVPPVATRFVPGDPRIQPKKRDASWSYKDWLNQLQDSTPDELMTIIRGTKNSALKIAAARDILARACPGDLADFEDYCDGRITLQEARDKGIPTDWLKKVKVKTHTDKDGNTETTREIELKDDAHKSLDRVLDRTGGKPAQEIKHEHTGGMGLGIVIKIEDGSAPELPPPPGTLKLPEHGPRSTPEDDGDGPKPAA